MYLSTDIIIRKENRMSKIAKKNGPRRERALVKREEDEMEARKEEAKNKKPKQAAFKSKPKPKPKPKTKSYY